MSKIAVRGGHCPKVPGARGILDELTENRLVKNSVIKYLRQLGHEVLDVTPPDSTSTSNSDLAYGVNEAIIGVLIYLHQYILIRLMIVIMER